MISIDWKNPLEIINMRHPLWERLPSYCTLFIGIVIAYQLGFLTWRLFPGPVSKSAPVGFMLSQQASNVNLSNSAHSQVMTPAFISGLHLFGKFEKKLESDKIIPDSLPQTSLRLSLRGVVVTNRAKQALAVIADESGNDDYYALGDILPGDATLVEIHADRVVLQRNGQYETLMMPPDEEITLQPFVPPNQGDSDSGQDGHTESIPPPGGAVNSHQYDNAETRGLLKQYQQSLSANPQSVLGLVRATPVNVGNELKGYRIRPGNDPEMFRKFGLRPGDVVTSINDVPLNNPIKLLDVLKNVTNAADLRLEVLRGGVNQSLNFGIGE